MTKQRQMTFQTVVVRQVMARRDLGQPYCPGNCYWRMPVSEKEERMGIEDLGLDEPDVIPLTAEQQSQREGLSDKEKETFDIWARMIWRGNNFGG